MNGESTPVSVDLHLTTVTTTTETLAAFVLFLVAGAFVSIVVAHFINRSVDPISDAVSDLGVGEARWFYRLTAIWLGFAGLLAAVMLGDALYPKPTIVILLLMVFAATRWAITLFPVDLPGAEETSTGRSHTVLAIIAFSSIVLAAGILPLNVQDDHFWDDKFNLLIGLTIFLTLTGAATGVTRKAAATHFFGLAERLFYLAMFAWLAGVSLMLVG